MTHKTFGEYLAARRFARLIEDLHQNVPAGVWNESDGLRRWYQLTYAARITLEILAFLQDELGALPLEEVQARRYTLIKLFDENLAKGMPYLGVDSRGQPKDYREAERFTAAAELALLAAIGVCSLAVDGKVRGLDLKARHQAVSWTPAWPDQDRGIRTSAWDLLRRLEAGTSGDDCVRGYLLGINLHRQVVRTSKPLIT